MAEANFTFTVEGMHCSGCANLVRSILEDDVEGVTKAVVDLDRKEVEITAEDGTFNQQNAAEIMVKNGYKLV
ncbi:MAG TPA: copper chaperone [Bacteroidetes bacterium]|nr:heavy-metal-associated domain protein [bacterium BMS3Bbin04]HDO65713.1 copper chaperone [Bacteroidota bacterium]HEX04838.1 copper chaperone [Bacteroidota bacterium]